MIDKLKDLFYWLRFPYISAYKVVYKDPLGDKIENYFFDETSIGEIQKNSRSIYGRQS